MPDPIADWIAHDGRYQSSAADAGGLYLAEHGAARIVFTAPHSVRHLRRGVEKRADIRTGGLAELLAAIAGGRSLAATGLPREDPNWHDGPTPFRRSLLALLRPDDLVVDLHGMGDEHGVDVVIGLGPGPDRRSLQAAERLREALGAHRLTCRTGHPFPALHAGTVTATVQAAGRSALQVEIAARRRHPLREPDLARPLALALAAWAEAAHAAAERAIS